MAVRFQDRFSLPAAIIESVKVQGQDVARVGVRADCKRDAVGLKLPVGSSLYIIKIIFFSNLY